MSNFTLKTLFASALACFSLSSYAAPELPTFSEDAADVTEGTYYHIKFIRGGAHLQDMGDCTLLLTAVADWESDAQRWKLVGDENSFQLVSKLGNIAELDGSRFSTFSTSDATFHLVASTDESGNDCWNICVEGNDETGFNQWGGGGAGKEIGEYNVGDGGNALVFISEQVVTPKPTLSSDDNEVWYNIVFERSSSTNTTDYPEGKGSLQDMGDGAFVLTKELDPSNDAQSWKVVGDDYDNVTIVSKLGNSLFLTTDPAEADAAMFATSSTEATAMKVIDFGDDKFLQLQPVDDTEGMAANLFRGGGLNRQLSLYYLGDGGNQLQFYAIDLSGVKTVANEGLAISARGGVIAANGAKVVVYDLTGKQLAAGESVTANANWGKVVIVKATKNGKVVAKKVAL